MGELTCACDSNAGRYSTDCPRHASYRCVTCNRAAVDSHMCGPCGRRVGVR